VNKHYAHIVIGAGALGTATAYWLARSGSTDVLVLEQFDLGHELGASEDYSRIIRHAYHSPTYTALTPAAYETWAHIEGETTLKLVTRTGGLDLAISGTAGADEIDNYRRSLEVAGIGWEDLTADDIRQRYPQWNIDDDVVGMFQEDGGIIDIRKACAAHVGLARALGVEFMPQTPVRSIGSTPDHVTVETDRGTFVADSVALCVASWIPNFLGDLGLDWNITLSQEQVTYFATPNLRDFSIDRFPIWIWHGDDVFYGFPVYGNPAIKASRDMAGRFVTVDSRSHEPDASEEAYIERFLRQRLPKAVGPVFASKTCVYDMPPDRDFILDVVPGHPRIAVGIGGGHAAKFGSLLGQILADLVIRGETKYPIDAFRVDRPALTDPNFTPTFRLLGDEAAAVADRGPSDP
jgi:monomeric sarcosine oxidase